MMSTDLTFKKEVNVSVSAQAQKVLSHSGYTLEEFMDWCNTHRKFTFGGELALLFLDQMPTKGDVQ